MCAGCATTLGAQATDAGGGLQLLSDTFDVCPVHRGQPLPAAEKTP
jgi:hypothetical protein